MMDASENTRMILFIQRDLKIKPKLLLLRLRSFNIRRLESLKVAMEILKNVKSIIWVTN